MKKYITFLFGFTLLTILAMNLAVAGNYTCEDGVCVYHDEININSNPGGSQPGETTTTGGPGGSALISFWQCEEEWSECINGTQTRTCEDLRGYEDNKTETRGCIPSFIPEKKQGNETLNTNPQHLFSTMTGAVIGTLGKGGSLLAAIFAFVIIAGLIAMAVNKKKK